MSDLIAECKPYKVLPRRYRDRQVGALRLDSRKVEEGDVYIALKGTQYDGHEFVHGAAMKGAGAVIVDRLMESLEDTVQIVVKDTRNIAGGLFQAFAGHPAHDMKLIGITGTNGKTTIATLMHQALKKKGCTTTMLGTVDTIIADERRESRLTTPGPDELAELMLKSRDKGVTHVVMEVSSHALEQMRTDGLDFDVAVFTNLSHDHLDYHRDAGAYLKAKKRLFDKLTPEASAIVNTDDEAAEKIIASCKAQIIRVGFGQKDAAVISSDSEGNVISWKGVEVRSPLIGSFNASNLLLAATALNESGLTPEEIAEVLPGCEGAAGRLEAVGPGKPVVLVDYAHSPDALENVLQAISAIKAEQEHLSVVFGCGGDRDTTKRPQMARIAEQYADRVWVTSDNPRTEDPEAIISEICEGFANKAAITREPDRRTAISRAIKEAPKQGIVLIAGKGHETYQEVEGVRHHLDDREEARRALGVEEPERNGKEAG